MPPSGALPISADSNEEEAPITDGKCLWSNILKEVTHKASLKLPSTRALVVLGDDECGKTTLIAKLQRTEDPKKSFGLEYTFLDIKDEDRDDKTKLNVWLLGGDTAHSRLLKFALHEKNFGECVAILVVDMSEPWKIMESLEKWSAILEKHISSLDIPMETSSEYRDGLVRQFREYVEPDALTTATTASTPVAHVPLATAPINARRPLPAGLHPATAALLSSTLSSGPQPTTPAAAAASETTNAAATDVNGEKETSGQHQDAASAEPPFDGTTMSKNLGIPMVVVVTKTDAMNGLEKEENFTEEHFDFIQMHIRRFCLKYGAALFYVSVKENKHCDLLNRYLQSRIYGFPFTQAAYVVERDCIFVPTGWDSEKKISILEENFSKIRSTDAYEEVIKPPQPRKTLVRDPELTALDEQSFLTRLLADLQRDGGVSGPGGAGGGSDSIMDKLGGTPPGGPGGPRSGTASPRISTPVGMRTKPTPPGSGGTGGTGGPGAPGSGAAGSPANNRPSEGVLANFFTSLLNKRSNVPNAGSPAGSPAGAPGSGDKIGMSQKDMQMELERLAQSSREALGTPKAQQPKTADAENKPTAQPSKQPTAEPKLSTPSEQAPPAEPQ